MRLHDLLLSLTAFASEILGTLSGFGSSSFFVPVAVHLESFQFVLALTAILHCFGNTSKIVLFRKSFLLKPFLQLVIPSLILSCVGAVLTTYLPTQILYRGLGIVLVLFSGIFLLRGLVFRRMPDWIAISLSGFSGFTTGLVGTGGTIRGLALASMNIERHSFVAISSAIDFGGDFLRMVIYLRAGYMDWSQWFYLPLLGIAALLGTYMGKRILAFVNQKQFEKIVVIFVLLAGILMVFE